MRKGDTIEIDSSFATGRHIVVVEFKSGEQRIVWAGESVNTADVIAEEWSKDNEIKLAFSATRA